MQKKHYSSENDKNKPISGHSPGASHAKTPLAQPERLGAAFESAAPTARAPSALSSLSQATLLALQDLLRQGEAENTLRSYAKVHRTINSRCLATERLPAQRHLGCVL